MGFLISIEESEHHSLHLKLRIFVVVPLAGIEPALLAESDFESDASTSSAIGACVSYKPTFSYKASGKLKNYYIFFCYQFCLKS